MKPAGIVAAIITTWAKPKSAGPEKNSQVWRETYHEPPPPDLAEKRAINEQAEAAKRQDEEAMRQKAALALEEERRRLEEGRKREMARKKALAQPMDGTAEFARIKDFYERYIDHNFYIKGLYYPVGLTRNRERKCYSVRFGNRFAAVTGGPYANDLSFIASDAMGEKLLDLRALVAATTADAFEATCYVNMRYLDEQNTRYPVGYITRIEFTDYDRNDVLKTYLAITITDDGKIIAHPNPYKK